jgi:chromosome segregation ATPase
MLAEMKKKNDKYVLELNQAKKDLSLKTEELKQIDVLNNQIEKYRVMSNDRISLLAQIEEKSNKILELNSKLKEKEEDIERVTKINKSLTDKLKQDEAEISSLENKLSELNAKLNEYLKDKETAIASVQKKYDLLQQKFINYTCSDEKNNKMNPFNLIEIINDSLTEFCELFKNKIDKISSELKVIKDNMFNSDEQLSKTIEKINLELKEVIQNTHKNLEEGYKNSIIIIENEIKSKLQERFDWQNKYIDQLMEFKIKAVNLEIKVNSLEEKNKNLEDMANVKGNENENLNKLLVEKDDYINNLNFKVSDLDDFNKKLKNFILRGKTLNEFDKFLKELGKQ